jgi:carboxylate-amine ligase
MLALIRQDAEYFGYVPLVEHARLILERGTSAHWQTETYDQARRAGATHEEALQAVVDMLIEETMHGL